MFRHGFGVVEKTALTMGCGNIVFSGAHAIVQSANVSLSNRYPDRIPRGRRVVGPLDFLPVSPVSFLYEGPVENTQDGTRHWSRAGDLETSLRTGGNRRLRASEITCPTCKSSTASCE